MNDNGSRPHGQTNAASLAATPLGGYGIRELMVLRAITTGAVEHDCEITVLSPRTDDDRVPQQPSIVLAHPPDFEMLRTATRAERACFEWDGATQRCQVLLPEGSSLYGTGEVAGPLLRNARSATLWNSDAWAYSDATPALYQSHPYVLAVLPDGRAVGLLADTSYRGLVHTAGDGIEFAFESEPFDLYRIEGDSPQAVQRALAALIGSIEEPPEWALGYHQCRWSYSTAEEIRALATEFKRRELPCSAIWFDIDYMDRWRVFTWSAERFPDPAGLISELHSMGFRSVAIVDPGIAIAKGYEAYESGLEHEHFIQLENGRPASGRVWPGLCHFPDFTRDATRAWWAERVKRMLESAPLDGLWCDMNEPALFRTPTKTLPENARHRGMGGGSHARFHNLYGQLMAEATRDGWMQANPGERPFVLTRASHLSGARFAATWTGDNQARWEDLEWAIPMLLNLGLSGQPFSGPDVGGFFGDPEPELFERWFELGPYLPFFRGHSDKGSYRKEPWSFGAESEARIKRNLELRERLHPLLVQLFSEAASSGMPVCRPLFFSAPNDSELRAPGDAFTLGDDVLVAPVVAAGARTKHVVLPPGRWRALVDGSPTGECLGDPQHTTQIDVDAPLGRAPAFARDGFVLPS